LFYADAIDPPPFLAYRKPGFLSLIERIYDLERFSVEVEDIHELPAFFRSRKLLRNRNGFFLPFQFYATLPLQTAESKISYFESMAEWSKQTGNNLTYSCLENYAGAQSIVVARNPVLFLPKDLQALEDGFSSNLRSNLRRNSNKAHRMGVAIAESSEERDLRDFYLYVLAPQYVRKHKMLFHPYATYRGLLEQGLARLIIARQNARVIGGLVLVEDVGGLHYAWGASEAPEQLAIGALMLHHALNAAVIQGLDWFDFGSTPLTDDALHAFKLRWGSKSFPVRSYYTLKQQPKVDLNNSFRKARQIYSYMSPRLACRLMPKLIPWLVF
jgi:hypothetical protein